MAEATPEKQELRHNIAPKVYIVLTGAERFGKQKNEMSCLGSPESQYERW